MFFILNFFSLSFSNKEKKLVKFGVFEQFFSVTKVSNDIIEKMFSNKMQNNKSSKKEKNSNSTKLNEYLVPILLSITHSNSSIFLNANNISFFVLDILCFDIYYPLKIPFLSFIFLLLLTKILFNVLPRSISINYNKLNIEKACIV